MCPEAKPGSACAFEIPVSIQSSDDLRTLIKSVIEVQGQRVFFGTFTEQLLGEVDPNVGREMDRLLNLVSKWKEIEDTRDTVKIAVEAHASQGVISRLFGSVAGKNARPYVETDPDDDAPGSDE